MGDDSDSRLKPTVVPVPARQRVLKTHVDAPTAVERGAVAKSRPLQPTMIAGASRQRLSVAAPDLLRLSPQAGKPVLDTALSMLSAFVVEKASERKAILWGHDLQKAYADLVARALELSQSPLMRRMQGHVSRLLEILEGFDLSAAAQSGGGFLKAFNRKIDTVAELATSRGELDQLTRLLGGGLEDLLQLKEALQTNAQLQEGMTIDIEAAALGALFLSELFRATNAALGDRFLDRSMSLTQTLAQIRGHGSLRSLQVEQPIHTIAAIQNVTLVTMPDFLVSLGALGSLRRDGSVTPTEASELAYKLQNIVRQLHP